jgi:hypothetical protein
MKNLTFLIVFVFIPLSFAQHIDDLTQIIYKGDYLIIPENKLGEFFRNYTPKEKTAFTKPHGEIILDGYVTDAFTNEPLEGIKCNLAVSEPPWITWDTLKTITDWEGHYSYTIVGINDMQNIENIGQIKYYIINTPTIELYLKKLSKVQIKLYDMLGQEIKTLIHEETSNKIVNTNIENLANGVYLLQTIIDGKPYTNRILKVGNNYKLGKSHDDIGEKNNLEKITQLGGGMWLIDTTNQHHTYNQPLGNLTTRTEHLIDMPRMYLDSIIVDPNYPVIDTIQTFRDFYWYLYDIQGEEDNNAYAPVLYPFEVYIDTSNCPADWKQPIRNAIQYWRDSMAVYLNMNPDSLIIESPEFNDPMSSLPFSPINMYYATEIPGNWDSGRNQYLDASNNVFTGMDIYLNLSSGMQPIDVYKEINRQLEEYIVGISSPPGRNPPGLLIDRKRRGPPYEPQKNDKEITKMSHNTQAINPSTYYNRIFP